MTQIKLRRDTSAAFASSNPILGNGEPAYETDTKKLKIGDGTTAYTQLGYFSTGGGGSSTDITATLPLKIVDGVISLEVDGQTIQVVDGKLHANLDELGNEVTDLSGRVTTVESEVANKQDKFTTASPLDIKNVASVSLRDVTISGDNLLFGNNNLLTGQVGDSISTSSTFAQSIQTGIVIPYKFGQVLQFHCGADTYVQGSNRRYGSPCVALFGHFNSAGDFVTALAINGFASYVSSSIRGNMGGALKAGAVSMLPNKTYQTTSGKSSVERGENTINMGTDYSTYIQLMVNEAGNLMQGIYGHYGTNSTNVSWGAMARTDVIQDRSLDSGQTVADIIAAIDTAVIIKGSDFGTIKKANFGLYNYSERLPWTQSGYDTFIANKGDNLIDLDNPSIKPQLQLNIGDGLSVIGGKLTTANMVTTNTTQTITGLKTFSAGIKGDGYIGDTGLTDLVYTDVNSNPHVGNVNRTLTIHTNPIGHGRILVDTGSSNYEDIHTGNIADFIDGTSITFTNNKLSATGSGSSANIPLAFGMSQYYKGEMNNVSWLKSEGQQNTKALYPDFYAWVLEKANAGTDGFKLSTATDITDYDFVLNTADETFRLPLLDGSEDLVSDRCDDLELLASGSTYTAPANGWYALSKMSKGAEYIHLSNQTAKFNIEQRVSGTGQGLSGYLPVKKGNDVYIKYSAGGATSFFRFIYAQGNGSLYYYVGETVQNANLIDAGRIGEVLATKTDMLQASGAGMPSDKYIDLTLGKSGSTYTAPANGWFACYKGGLTTTGYLYMRNNANQLAIETRSVLNGTAVSAYVPVQKGQSILVNYDAVGTVNLFRFIYAEGSK